MFNLFIQSITSKDYKICFYESDSAKCGNYEKKIKLSKFSDFDSMVFTDATSIDILCANNLIDSKGNPLYIDLTKFASLTRQVKIEISGVTDHTKVCFLGNSVPTVFSLSKIDAYFKSAGLITIESTKALDSGFYAIGEIPMFLKTHDIVSDFSSIANLEQIELAYLSTTTELVSAEFRVESIGDGSNTVIDLVAPEDADIKFTQFETDMLATYYGAHLIFSQTEDLILKKSYIFNFDKVDGEITFDLTTPRSLSLSCLAGSAGFDARDTTINCKASTTIKFLDSAWGMWPNYITLRRSDDIETTVVLEGMNIPLRIDQSKGKISIITIGSASIKELYVQSDEVSFIGSLSTADAHLTINQVQCIQDEVTIKLQHQKLGLSIDALKVSGKKATFSGDSLVFIHTAYIGQAELHFNKLGLANSVFYLDFDENSCGSVEYTTLEKPDGTDVKFVPNFIGTNPQYWEDKGGEGFTLFTPGINQDFFVEFPLEGKRGFNYNTAIFVQVFDDNSNKIERATNLPYDHVYNCAYLNSNEAGTPDDCKQMADTDNINDFIDEDSFDVTIIIGDANNLSLYFHPQNSYYIKSSDDKVKTITFTKSFAQAYRIQLENIEATISQEWDGELSVDEIEMKNSKIITERTFNTLRSAIVDKSSYNSFDPESFIPQVMTVTSQVSVVKFANLHFHLDDDCEIKIINSLPSLTLNNFATESKITSEGVASTELFPPLTILPQSSTVTIDDVWPADFDKLRVINPTGKIILKGKTFPGTIDAGNLNKVFTLQLEQPGVSLDRLHLSDAPVVFAGEAISINQLELEGSININAENEKLKTKYVGFNNGIQVVHTIHTDDVSVHGIGAVTVDNLVFDDKMYVYYDLAHLPYARFDMELDTPTRRTVEFHYDTPDYVELAKKSSPIFERVPMKIVCGHNMNCINWELNFIAEDVPEFNSNTSLLNATCQALADDEYCIVIHSSSSAAPTPKPDPVIPVDPTNSSSGLLVFLAIVVFVFGIGIAVFIYFFYFRRQRVIGYVYENLENPSIPASSI